MASSSMQNRKTTQKVYKHRRLYTIAPCHLELSSISGLPQCRTWNFPYNLKKQIQLHNDKDFSGSMGKIFNFILQGKTQQESWLDLFNILRFPLQLPNIVYLTTFLPFISLNSPATTHSPCHHTSTPYTCTYACTHECTNKYTHMSISLYLAFFLYKDL